MNRKNIKLFGILAFTLLLNATLNAEVNKNPKVGCEQIKAVPMEEIEIVGSWSNHEADGEHEWGYNVVLLKVGKDLAGLIEDLSGLVGDGGINYPMVEIDYKPGKSLSFGAYIQGSEDPNTPWPYFMELKKDHADLRIDQYRTEKLKGSETPDIDPKYKKWTIEPYITRALKCK